MWFKAIKGSSWQFHIDRFLEVRIEGDRQVVRGKKPLSDRTRVCIFVRIRPNSGGSEGDFYVFRLHELQDFFFKTYTGRVKPQDITSYHCAIWPKDLHQHRNQWQVLTEALHGRESSDVDAAQDISEEIAGKAPRGQGFQFSAAERQTIELHAMKRAEEYYRAKGWSVENVSARASYDLRCRRADGELHVEVKGTKSVGDEILLTANEVEHARTYRQVALFVVSRIVITSDAEGKPRAQGGEETILDPWEVHDSQLIPLAFAWRHG